MSVDIVNDVEPRVQYTASAAQTDFDYPFPIFADEDIVVDIDGAVQALTTDYTVAGEGQDAGGTVTLVVAATGGEVVTLYRDLPIERVTDFQQNGRFAASSFNDELDKLVMIQQQLKSKVERSLRVPYADPANVSDMELPGAAGRAGYFLKFNDTTGAPEMATFAGVGTVISASTLYPLLNPRTTAETAAGETPTSYIDYIDVGRFGAVGDGVDETAEIQSAFNAARYGKSRVHFPARNLNGATVYACSGITVYEGTHVTADQGVIIRKSGGAAFSHIFDCVSTLGTGTALTANAAKGATTVAVTSVSGLAAGQLVMVRDATYKYSTSGRNLELNEIDSIASLNVTLKNRLIGAYTTASSAELVPVTLPKRNIKFENVVCDIPAGISGGPFYFENAYDCDVINCKAYGMEDQAGVQTWRSAYIRVRGGHYHDGQELSTPGSGYGISFGEASHHCTAIGVQTSNVRENAFGANARHSQFIDCVAVAPYDSGFNSHANGVEDCDVVNCSTYSSRVYGFVSGFTGSSAADKRIRFINCRSYDSGSYGFWSGADVSRENEDIEFIDCVSVRPGVSTGSNYGFLVSRCTRPKVINCRVIGSSANVRAGIHVEVCTDAVVRGGEVRDVTSGWGVIHTQCTGVLIEDVNIFDIGSNQGVYGPATASTKAVIRNCRVNNDIAFTKNSGDLLEDIVYNTKFQSARGATSVADGGTISHGLVGTPSSVRVSASVTGEFASVTATGSSTFTVAIKKHDNSAGTTQTVYWEAEV